jgi:hypothetical protein
MRIDEEYTANAADTLGLAERASAPWRTNSARVQKCLDRARYCEHAASIVTSTGARATFLEAARSWREMAEQYRKRERIEALISDRYPGLLGAA